MNIDSAILLGAKLLKKNFIKSPELDSEILLAKVLEKEREYIKRNTFNYQKFRIKWIN